MFGPRRALWWAFLKQSNLESWECFTIGGHIGGLLKIYILESLECFALGGHFGGLFKNNIIYRVVSVWPLVGTLVGLFKTI